MLDSLEVMEPILHTSSMAEKPFKREGIIIIEPTSQPYGGEPPSESRRQHQSSPVGVEFRIYTAKLNYGSLRLGVWLL